MIRSAKFDFAETLLTELIGEQPAAPIAAEAHYNLAVARRYRKDFDGALASLAELTALNPDYGRAHQERGHTLLALNRPDEAAAAFTKATELNPGLVASWRALAALHERAGRNALAEHARSQVEYMAGLPADLVAVTDLLFEGRLYKAEALCRQFLAEHPHHVEAMRLLAELGVRLRVLDDAEFLLESCVEFEPDNLRARADYLRVLNRKGKFEKALAQAKILRQEQPGNPVYQLATGNALVGLGRLDEGIGWYEKGRERTGNKAGVDVMLGHALKAKGELDEAIRCYRRAWRLRPDCGDAFWSLANIKTYRFTDEEILHIERYESAAGVAPDDRVHLCFAAGKAHEDRGDYERSFEYYTRGNALKMQRSGYDPDRTSAMVDAQIEICTKRLFEERGGLGCERPDPIFIVGLPRAGSTLLEQILASHSMVDGTMELQEMLGLVQRLRGRSVEKDPAYPRNLQTIDRDYFRRFGEKYLEDTRVYRDGAPLFIDKMPNNFMHVGLIRLILPRAKVIDARRHPMACCFSGFKQLFGEGQDFSYGLEAMGGYYRDYVRLMDHWEQVLPGFVLRVEHEDVVDDLETQVRRILEFCDLPFEEACLRFHETERAIKTPSAQQVRQPIYRTGLEHWKHFEPWLEPLKKALGEDVRRKYAID